MARAQKSKTVTKNPVEKQPQKQEKPISGVAPANSKVPTAKEILFLKIGVSFMVLLVLAVGIYFAIQLFSNRNKDSENPYNTSLFIYGEDLVNLTKPDDLSGGYPYGNFDYFNNADEFPATDDYEAKAIYNLIKDAKVIYVFIYSMNDMDDDVKAEIKEHKEQYKDLLLFLQLDHPRNNGLLENPNLSHLNLKSNSNQLLIFNVEPSSSSTDDFEIIVDKPATTSVNELLEAIKKIIQ